MHNINTKNIRKSEQGKMHNKGNAKRMLKEINIGMLKGSPKGPVGRSYDAARRRPWCSSRGAGQAPRKQKASEAVRPADRNSTESLPTHSGGWHRQLSLLSQLDNWQAVLCAGPGTQRRQSAAPML